MFGSFPEPAHMPCPDCGASVARADTAVHVCDDSRWLDFQMFQLREEIQLFSSALAAYLCSPQGRFDVFYAERERRLRPATGSE